MSFELAHDDGSTETTAYDAEQALLAAALTGDGLVSECADLIGEADFSDPRNGSVWLACCSTWAAGERVNPASLSVPARARPYLVELVGVPGEPVLARRYAERILAAGVRRRMVNASIAVRQLAEQEGDPLALAEDARAAVDAIAGEGTVVDTGIAMRELFDNEIARLERGKEESSGLLTGWYDLDDVVNGLRPGTLCVVGARPSVGKSVIAGNIAAAACKAGVGVHFASLEMSRSELWSRIVAAESKVDLGRLLRADLNSAEWERVAAVQADMAAWPLWIDDQGGQSLNQIRARARSTSRRMPLGLIVVDYLQIMSTSGNERANREQQIGDLSTGMKTLSKELGAPVIALSQVNRGPMARQDPRPQMSDLRESGRIEADADHVWLLHRQDLVDGDKEPNGEMEIYVAKNRNGPMGRTVRLTFFGQFSKAANRYEPTTVPPPPSYTERLRLVGDEA